MRWHTLEPKHPRCGCVMAEGLNSDPAGPKNRSKFIIIKGVVLDFPWHYQDRSADLCLLGGEIQSHVEDRFKSCACLNTTQCLRRNARSFEKHSFKGLSGTRVAQGPPAKDSVSTPVVRRRVYLSQRAPQSFFLLSLPLHKSGICWRAKEMSKLLRMEQLLKGYLFVATEQRFTWLQDDRDWC